MKTERSLLEAGERNRELAAEMQDQKNGFSVQMQLWEVARANLEAKVHELETMLIKNELLLQEAVANKKQIDTCTNCLLLEYNDVSTKDKSQLVLQSEGTSETTDCLTKDALRKDSQASDAFAELEDNILHGGTQSDNLSQHTKRLEGGNSLNVTSILKRLGLPLTLIIPNESNDAMQKNEMLLEVPNLIDKPTTKSNEQNIEDKAPVQGCDQLEPPVTRTNFEAQRVFIDPVKRKQLPSTKQDAKGVEVEGPSHGFDVKQQDKTPPKVEVQLMLSKLDELQSERVHLVSEEQQPLEFANLSAPIKVIGSKSESTCKSHLMLPESSKLPGTEHLLKLDKLEVEQGNPANEAIVPEQQEPSTFQARLMGTLLQEFLVEPDEKGKPYAHEVDEHQEDEALLQEFLIEPRKPHAHEVDEHQEDEAHPISQRLVTSLLEQEKEILPSGEHKVNLDHDAVQQAEGDGVQKDARETKFLQTLETNAGSELCHETVLPIKYSASPFKRDAGKEGLPLDATYKSEPEVEILKQNTANQNKGSKIDAQLRCSPILKTEPKLCKKKAFVPNSANECFCNMPAYGYMVNCKACGTCFHAACLQSEEISPGESYTCKSCKDQPHRKRRQVQSTKVGTEN